MKRNGRWPLFAVLIIISQFGECQETVFAALQSETKLAEKFYGEGGFQKALQLYSNVRRKNAADDKALLRIAECYYNLKDYPETIASYDILISHDYGLPLDDLFCYAEAQAVVGNYDKAIMYYRKYLSEKPEDEMVTKKIWRLNNIQYLYEDSAHYAVKLISLNTNFSEFSPMPYKNGLIFTSNRKIVRPVEMVNANLGSPFYRVYFSRLWQDSVTGALHAEYPTKFDSEFNSRFNTGPVAFFKKQSVMAFIRSAPKVGPEGMRILGLYFAQKGKDTWENVSAYPYNSDQYNISSFTISEDGKNLYISSDMKGGIGKKDLYKSQLINDRWTKPENMGELINTTEDEVFPYLHKERILYFSSNGHAGLGGLDIFKTVITSGTLMESENVGYPLNSSYDDFGLVLDSLDTHGYFSSNRKLGGYDDDIYELDMDLQSYPITITGVIKYKDRTWSDQSELKVWPDCKIFLVDNIRNTKVYEAASDADGNFSIVIPYFSKYFIQAIDERGIEYRASLEIIKYRKELSSYEIVMVKDVFESGADQK